MAMQWGDAQPLETAYVDPTCASLRAPAQSDESCCLFLDLEELTSLLDDIGNSLDTKDKEVPDLQSVLPRFASTLAQGDLGRPPAGKAQNLLIGPLVKRAALDSAARAQAVAALIVKLMTLPSQPQPATQAMGLVDFSIGFLNRRFRKADNTTRFEMLWLQDRMVANPPAYGQALGNGTLLLQDDINQLIQRHTVGGQLDESAAYAEILPGPPGLRNPHQQRISHGTAVLDQMAGAEPGSLDQVALYGVELPTEVIADTSGARLMPPMMTGLTAIALISFLVPLFRGQDAGIPLHLNASLSFTGGPASARNPNAQMLAHLMAVLQAQAAGRRNISLTVPSGNQLQDRIHARAPAGTDLQWVLPPDDKTPSLVEIFQDGEGLLDLQEVVLTPPGQAAINVPIPPVGSYRDLQDTAGQLVGRLSRPGRPATAFIADWPDHLVLALNATAHLDPAEPLAPAGIWRLQVTGGTREALFWIRRDDTLGGFAAAGRQSHFRDAAYQRFDETGDFALSDPPGTASAIRRDGTLSALAHAGGAHGITAATNDSYRFAGRASGANLSQSLAEESRIKGGPLAAARFGPMTLRLHGTSLASGVMARHLAGLPPGVGPLSPPRPTREY